MKCMFCPATFETVEIETGFVDQAKRAAAEKRLAAQQAEGEKWEHFRATVTRNGASVEIFAGYICPNENIQNIQVSKA